MPKERKYVNAGRVTVVVDGVEIKPGQSVPLVESSWHKADTLGLYVELNEQGAGRVELVENR